MTYGLAQMTESYHVMAELLKPELLKSGLFKDFRILEKQGTYRSKSLEHLIFFDPSDKIPTTK